MNCRAEQGQPAAVALSAAHQIPFYTAGMRVGLLGGEFDVLSRIGGPTVVTARFRRWRAA